MLAVVVSFLPLSASAARLVIKDQCVLAADRSPGRPGISSIASLPEDAMVLKKRDNLMVVGKSDGPGIASAGPEVFLTKEHEEFCSHVGSRLGMLSEPNYVYTASQSALETPSLWGLDIIGMETARATTTGSSSVLVGIVDTGIDYTHPDLAANVAKNTGEIPDNYIDDDGNGYIDDYYGYDFINEDSDPMGDHDHGTHVAGTIGAAGIEGGVVGINMHVGLVAAKALNSQGSGTLDSVVNSINYLVKRGVKVINMSLGSSGSSTIEFNAISNARMHGVLVAAAAGNDSQNNDYYGSYPANYNLDNVISVAASGQSDTLAYFSNYGAHSVDLAAPGVEILSTLVGGGYGEMSGTSMATPHVAGVAALLLAVNPNFSYTDLRRLILDNGDYVSALDGYMINSVRLSAENSVAAALTRSPHPDSFSVALKKGRGSYPGRKKFTATVKENGTVLAHALVTFTCNNAKRGTGYTSKTGKVTKELKVKSGQKCRASISNGTKSPAV